MVRQLDMDYQKRFGVPPPSDPDLFYFLGDRYEWSRTWTAGSKPKALPTFRKNPGKYLHRSTMRAMTPTDKLAALGWPVTEGTAVEMGTSVMPSLDPARSACMAGNSMHLTVASIMLLLGLSCFGKPPRG